MIVLTYCCLPVLIFNSLQQLRTQLAINEVYVLSDNIHTNQVRSIDQAVAQMDIQHELLTNGIRGIAGLRNTLHSIADNASQPQNSTLAHGLPSQTTIGIKADVLNPHLRPHASGHKCSCSGSRRFRSLRFLNSLLGALFIGYSGRPFQVQRCARSSCTTRSAFIGQVHYYFPSWLFRRMLDLTITTSSFQEPTVSLTVRATLLPSSDLLRLVTNDDTDGLQQLFSGGYARPNDLLYGSGETALQVCCSLLCFFPLIF